MPDFKNCRAQNPRYLKPQKKNPKTVASKPNFSEENTGNRKPETGDQNNKMGPRGFEPLTYGCLRPNVLEVAI
jgi:hypothetical protein